MLKQDRGRSSPKTLQQHPEYVLEVGKIFAIVKMPYSAKTICHEFPNEKRNVSNMTFSEITLHAQGMNMTMNRT